MSKSMHISSINDLLIVCTVLLFLTWTSDFILDRPIADKLPRAVNFSGKLVALAMPNPKGQAA